MQKGPGETEMKWSEGEIAEFRENGYRFARGLLSTSEVESLRDGIPVLLSGEDEEDGMHRERERGGAVRQVFLAHRYHPAFAEVIRNPKILEPIKQAIGNDTYIFHSKLNVKEAFEGTVWLWHQDYGYWMWDGVGPNLVSAMIIIDEATLNNGCVMVVSGSHKGGRIEHEADTVTTSYKQWCIPPDDLKTVIREEDITHITGEPGDVLFFDCNLIHGSGHNAAPAKHLHCSLQRHRQQAQTSRRSETRLGRREAVRHRRISKTLLLQHPCQATGRQ